MKKVLMIAYIFPPMGGSGVHRTAKFVKYLPDFGWKPIVVCGETEGWHDYDSAKGYAAELGPVEVHRVKMWVLYRAVKVVVRPLFRLVRKLKGLARRGGPAGAESTAPAPAAAGGEKKGGLLQFLQIPDDRNVWFFPALRWCLRVCRSHEIDAIYSTSAPYTDHLVGWAVKRLTGKVWVADFRDSWVTNDVFMADKRPPFRRISTWLEAKVLIAADAIIANTNGFKNEFIQRYPGLAGRVVVIPNGFDAADFNVESVATEPSDTFMAAVIGELYAGRTPRELIKGFAGFLKSFPQIKGRLLFVGYRPPETESDIDGTAAECAVLPLVERRGPVAHREALDLMRQADVLVSILEDSPTDRLIYPSKVFEYAAAGRPVLSISPPGETEKLIAELEAGISCPCGDEAAIAEALGELYAHPQSYNANAERLGKYERKRLTGELAGVLNSLGGEV